VDEKVEILLIEDNPGDAGLIEEMLEEFADFLYELKSVETLNEGLSLLKERPFDVILLDLRLPDSDGINTFLDIHTRNSRIPIIILTGSNDEKIGIDAVKKGAQDYLVKGEVDSRLLKRSIQYSIERKNAEQQIRALANIVESSTDAIITKSLDGIITSWNKGAEQIYGYSAEEIMGKPISILEPSYSDEETQKLIEMFKQGKRINNYETLRLRKNGMVIDVSITLSPVFDASGELTSVSVIAREITERKRAEEAMAYIEIARKKEIHHRIKNNLQVISSLLDLQAEKFTNRKDIKDSEVIEAFRESQDRVISMALIHEELYKGSGFEKLNFSQYIEDLTKNLFLTYRIIGNQISLNMDVEEIILFDMDTAVPLGIIVNELVSNSLKHAFIGRNKGEIRIKLHRERNRECKIDECKSTNFILTVSDNGVGIHENLDIEDPDTLGLQLVTSLVDQLDGELEMKTDNDTEFTIRFTVTEQ
jgi:PAS domain S-box-containing protein